MFSVAIFQDRDKMYLTRTVIFQLVQALKFKSSLPDENLLLLVQVGYKARLSDMILSSISRL